MSDARWDRLEDLLARVTSVPEDRRAQFIEQETRDDPALGAELHGLLRLSEGADEYIDALRHELLGSHVDGILRVAAAGELPALDYHPASVPSLEQLNAALAGRYTVDELIGEGGMAAVYLARDVRHQRKVALKVLKPDLGSLLGVDRFLSEVQVTANLQHPNLLPLFDSGAAGNLLFYVMPFVEGESLRARLNRERQLPVDEAVRLTTAIASALDHAHRHGVIHRDLKPENVLLHEGQPLVADFGVALAVSNAGATRITQAGLSLGTPRYMSPEQATGDTAIDGRTDIYSLGAMTYEMLTGEPPHTGTSAQAIVARLLTERPRAIRSTRPATPEHVEAAVDRALERLPADRWATPKEFAEALSGARTMTRPLSSITSGDSDATRQKKGYVRSRPAPRELAAWAVAVLALGGLYVARPQRLPDPGAAAVFQLSVPPDLDLAPAGSVASVSISRDGSTIVFQAREANSGPALFVRRIDAPGIRRIEGSDDARAPVVSADGSEVLFMEAPLPGTIHARARRLPVAGGTPRVFIDSVVANGQISWPESGPIVVSAMDALWTVTEAGVRSLLARPDSARRHYRYMLPHVLPGGNAALIGILRGPSESAPDSIFLGIVTIPGGSVTELGIRGTQPLYSESGHLLYATSDGWIFAAPFDARSLTVTGPATPVVDGVRVGPAGVAAMSVSRTGTLVYVGGGTQNSSSELVAVDRAGVYRSLGMEPGLLYNPRVSPNGHQIALEVETSPRTGIEIPSDIWLFDTTSGAVIPVTADRRSRSPVWSSGGARVAYRSDADTTLHWVPVNPTGQAALLVEVPLVHAISLGPEHGYAALEIRTHGGPSGFDIWLVHTDSLASPRPFLTETYAETTPAVSPDGRWLAYATNRRGLGRYDVYVRSIPGGEEDIPISSGGGSGPVWSRDGREIFYRTANHLMSARLAVGQGLTVERRDTLFVATEFREPFDVFPGDSLFAMLRIPDDVDEFPLMVMLNWQRVLDTPASRSQP